MNHLWKEERVNIDPAKYDSTIRKTELVLVIGRGGTKCLSKRTWVPTSRGLKRIGSLRKSSGGIDLEIVGEGLSKDYARFYHDEGKKESIQIVTEFLGLSLIGSKEKHRVMVEGEWVFLKDLRAVIRRWRALSGIIGRKGRVGGIVSLF